MPKWIRGYKLIRRENNRMLSHTGREELGDCVEYKVGQITKPLKGCGPLFILTDNKIDGGVNCLPCLYLPSKRKEAWFVDVRYNSKYMVSLKDARLIYPDTAFATQVKLLIR